MAVLGGRVLGAAGMAVCCLGPVAGLAGPWTPLAAVPAAVLLALAARLRPSTVDGTAGVPVLAVLGAAVPAGVLARGAADYLVPGHPVVAAVALVAALAVPVGLRAACPPVLLALGLAFGAAALVLVVAAGYAIAPPPRPPELAPGPGLLPAALLPLGAAAPAGRFPWWAPPVAAAGFGGVALVAVHQLGAARLGLSPAPLADALRAADAAALLAPLVVGLALALLLGAYAALADAVAAVPGGSRVRAVLAPCLLAAAVAVLPVTAGVALAAATVLLRAFPGGRPAG